MSIVPEINERAPLTLCKLEPTSIIRVSETTTIIPVSLASDDERLPNDTVLDREQNRSSVRSWKDRYTAALGLVDCWPFSRLLHAYLYDSSSSLAVVCFTRLDFTRLLFPSSLSKIAATSGFLKLSAQVALFSRILRTRLFMLFGRALLTAHSALRRSRALHHRRHQLEECLLLGLLQRYQSSPIVVWSFESPPHIPIMERHE